MPPNRPPDDDKEDLTRFVTFSGTIARGDLIVPIRFRVRIGVDGDLRFRVYPIRLTNKSSALRLGAYNSGSKSPTYSISAVSAGGMRFESDGIVLRGTGSPLTPTTAYVTLQLGYTKAEFTLDGDNGETPPTIKWYLRGFEAIPAVKARCDLGEFVWSGKRPAKDADKISGAANIRAHASIADTSAWASEASKLFEHVRLIMSLGMARQIDFPIVDTWIDGQWRRVAYSQSKSPRRHQQVFHPMQLQPVLDAAITSHFAPPIEARSLDYAIEWLMMPTTYNEMRLTSVITALENLANANLPEADQLHLPPDTFNAFSKRLRDFATNDLAPTIQAGDERLAAAAQEMRAGMRAKLLDLNRRPLFDRLMRLADRWKVPLAGLDETSLRAAIPARNDIVHRGYYYKPGQERQAQADLWDHVLITRELAVRFVLTAIGYQGTYLSFRGGQHDVTFPPEPSQR